jgi:hypothetical protein
MEIKITQMADTNMFPFSHSCAEGGENAAKETWENALKMQSFLLTLDDFEKQAFLYFVENSGGWTKEEISKFDDNEINALALQWIAGDIREAGGNSLTSLDWDKYYKEASVGRISGRLVKCGENFYWNCSV